MKIAISIWISDILAKMYCDTNYASAMMTVKWKGVGSDVISGWWGCYATRWGCSNLGFTHHFVKISFFEIYFFVVGDSESFVAMDPPWLHVHISYNYTECYAYWKYRPKNVYVDLKCICPFKQLTFLYFGEQVWRSLALFRDSLEWPKSSYILQVLDNMWYYFMSLHSFDTKLQWYNNKPVSQRYYSIIPLRPPVGLWIIKYFITEANLNRTYCIPYCC